MDSHGLRSEKVPENFRYQVQRKMYLLESGEFLLPCNVVSQLSFLRVRPV